MARHPLPGPVQVADAKGLIAALAAGIGGEWPQIISVWEEFRQRHGYHLRADLEADQFEFLKEALWTAFGQRHLRALLNRFVEQGLANRSLFEAAMPLFGSGFVLHSYVNGRWQPQDALMAGRRLLAAFDHVCRISIDGRHRGTGVLIRPTLIATAAHVVGSLVGPTMEPAAGSVQRLSIMFFDSDALFSDGDVHEPEPVHAPLHEQWLGYYSPPARGEGSEGYPVESIEGIADEVGPWDLALIRLARPPRLGLKGYRISDTEPPAVRFGIHVLHHPADALGAPMGLIWSIGEMKHGLGAPRPLRWLHDANTDKGSSGAPCFDNDWRIIGLHQAGAAILSATGQSNRAVPIYPWAKRVEGLATATDLTPYLSYVLKEDGTSIAVFGRRDLQSSAWQAMLAPLPDKERVFVILGDPGSGKSFTARILANLARSAGCPFASLDVRNAQEDSALEFARRIVGAWGATLPDAVTAPGLTTSMRDIVNAVVPRLIQELETIADGHPLWLVLDGLELCDSPASEIGWLIEGLLGALESAPHLNLVLIGWKGPANAAYMEVVGKDISVEDVLSHLLLEVMPPGMVLGPEGHSMLHELARSALEKQSDENPFARAAAAVDAVKETVRALLVAAAKRHTSGETGS